GGTKRNRAHAETHARWADAVDEMARTLLCDAQTSGGLLLSVDADAADALVERMRAAGLTAARIGELTHGPAGAVLVRV
ncbi:MAG: AIR synthase-related protein, partial [Gemmatimonadota bacterium]